MAVMGVPESLAYAEIAGLPHVPWWHIVAAIVGCRKMRRVSDEDSVLELKALYRLTYIDDDMTRISPSDMAVRGTSASI